MSTPGKQPVFLITKVVAAQSQLESAIWLWFTINDAIAIRALAEAAHDCYYSLCKHKFRAFPSILDEYLTTRSKAFMKRQADIRNFLKHGDRKLTRKLVLEPIYADVMLLDSVKWHLDLTDCLITPLMRLYLIRFFLEYPAVLPPDAGLFANVHRDEFGEIEIAKMSRADFFKKFYPVSELLPAEIPP